MTRDSKGCVDLSGNEQVINGMIIKMGETKYTLPILSIKQSFKPNKKSLFTDPSGNEMVYVHEKVYNILRLHDVFNDTTAIKEIEDGILIMLESKGRRLCMLVDELLGERQVRIKPLPQYFEGSRFLNGCNVLDDGEISLVLDVASFFDNMPGVAFEDESELEVLEDEEAVDGSVEAEDTTKDKYFTFEVCGEEYGIEIAFIKEIVGICPITKLPETPDYAEGIVNIRGEIIPVINLRKRFSRPFKDYDAASCIVLLEYQEAVIGIIVDKVREVALIHENQIAPPPNIKLNYTNQFIKAIGKVGEDIKLLLDLEKTIA